MTINRFGSYGKLKQILEQEVELGLFQPDNKLLAEFELYTTPPGQSSEARESEYIYTENGPVRRPKGPVV